MKPLWSFAALVACVLALVHVHGVQGHNNDYSGYGDRQGPKVSLDGRCGRGWPETFQCRNGYCCSQYGFCGRSDKYCGKGCQSDYGDCFNYTAADAPNPTAPTDGVAPAPPQGDFNPCPQGATLCGGSCVNLTSSVRNCGACSNACAGPASGFGAAICVQGVCGLNCTSPYAIGPNATSGVDCVPVKPAEKVLTVNEALPYYAAWAMQAYCTDAILANGTACYASAANGSRLAGARNVVPLFNGPRSTLNGFAAMDGNTMVISFQGSASPADWLFNVNLEFVFVNKDLFPGAPFLSYTHFGHTLLFASGLGSVDAAIGSFVATQRPKRVVFVGHSLGGTLAALNYLYFYNRLTAQNIEVQAFTYEQPRFAGMIFSGWLANQPAVKSGNLHRVTRLGDVVPQMVPFVIYQHVGQEYYLDTLDLAATSPVRKCRPTSIFLEDFSCSFVTQSAVFLVEVETLVTAAFLAISSPFLIALEAVLRFFFGIDILNAQLSALVDLKKVFDPVADLHTNVLGFRG